MKKVEVCYVSRVEGQGSINVEVDEKGRVKRAEFAIFEPARFFEALLKGRKYSEVHELTSRICGICPIAHQMTALTAVENAFGVEVSEQTRELRRLLALSGWIQSHALSVFMLTLPDYMGFDGAISMASEHRELVETALRVKKLGNDIGEVVGGKPIHPISAVVGGFTKVPSRRDLSPFLERLEQGREDMLGVVDLMASLDYPETGLESELVSISRDDRYAVNEGLLASNKGLKAEEKEYRTIVVESEVPYSNAKQSRIKGRGTFMVGPLARVVLNHKSLGPVASSVLKEIGLDLESTDPFMNIRARVVEIVYSIEESMRIIKDLSLDVSERPVPVHVGVPCEGYALTEAPRGLLYHGYRFDRKGCVTFADIVPPTAHNSAHVEDALRSLAPRVIEQGRDLSFECEKLVRAYDPCISCSVHAFEVR